MIQAHKLTIKHGLELYALGNQNIQWIMPASYLKSIYNGVSLTPFFLALISVDLRFYLFLYCFHCLIFLIINFSCRFVKFRVEFLEISIILRPHIGYFYVLIPYGLVCYILNKILMV